MQTNYFPQKPDITPMIYAYEELNPKYEGLLKIGYTTKDVTKRVAEQYPTKRPDGLLPYKIVYSESAMREDGSIFTDHDIHKKLKQKHIENVGGEWFRCNINDVKSAIIAVKNNIENEENRTLSFVMRPEQKAAVEKTAAYFESIKKDNVVKFPKFLWNCKMRFGKTFTTYQLAKKMNYKKILILTFKPAVVTAWQEDLNTHIDFEGWQFISKDTTLTYEKADKNKPIVCFGSFQDFLGYNKETGGIKEKNEWVHTTHWDLVVFDEYHFGAWKENAKSLFENEDEDDVDDIDISTYKTKEIYDETFLPITTDYYLFLSGTPFRALNSGEFIEEQIYNWTYSDEQQAKENYIGEDNPYASLPRMVMLTYKIPDTITNIAKQGEFDEFDLNVFFSARGEDENAEFVYKNEVQKWLNLIRGEYLETKNDELKLGSKKPPFPYSDVELLNILQHTLWFLPNVASCYAMNNLLQEKNNKFFHDYKIIVAAGKKAGIGADALIPVKKAMAEPLKSKTITLSCGKLTTGVTVKPWTGIFMLRNLSSPETYFQSAFRVQSPWVIKDENGQQEIIKKECYVFDFALDRALKQISDYSSSLNINETNPEKKVAEFIKFLPVLAYDGSSMREINAADILDIALAGTSATLLAKRWESALLVNVDNDTLKRILNNPEVLSALMNIEDFRNLNRDIQTIINKSEAVKKAKTSNDKISANEKKKLDDEIKEYNKRRKEIQTKLIKLATRIPIFMYLTDYREYCLKDIITQLEPELFKKVTGLKINDFELLVSIGVFNDYLMNDAVYKFKRYEDSSLNYTGIDKHIGEKIGGWDTSISQEDYETLFPVKNITSAAVTIINAETTDEIKNKDNNSNIIENDKLNLNDIKENSKIYHKAFGSGIVKGFENDKIIVRFDKLEKKFQFPNAFLQGFLYLVK